jgi:phosphate transport system substrate-binding protein
MRRVFAITLLSVVAGSLGCSGHDVPSSGELEGAGSTFVYNVMSRWAHDYGQHPGGCKVSYRSWGSDAGIKAILDKKADFGCTDAPMTDEELAAARAAGGEVVHVPLVLGAVVPVYNLAEAKDPLRFTGPVLADIFLGKVKKWNDAALQALNHGVKLPDKEILVVHRRDGSGTTDIWTDYLSKVSPEWRKVPGRGLEVKWPVGQAESGNTGVAGYVKQNPGSLGYVELSYAHREDLPFGLVQNREGEFVKPRLQSIMAAADSALKEIPDDLRYSLTDAPGKASYPVSGTTWALVYTRQPAGKGRQLVDFLGWVLGEGQEDAEQLLYARLPEGLAARAHAKLDQIQVGQ